MKQTKQLETMLFSMLPDSASRVTYEDHVVMYDNFGFEMEPKSFDVKNPYKAVSFPMRMDFLLFIICVGGEMSIRANLVDYKLSKNDVLVISPNIIMESLKLTPDMRMALIALSDATYPLLPISDILNERQVDFTQPAYLHLDEERMKYMIDIYEMMRHTIQMSLETMTLIAIEGCLKVLFALLSNALSKQGMQPRLRHSRSESIYAQFLLDVNTYFSEHRDVGYYASLQCISPKYLGQVVSKQSGVHPIDHIRNRVILEAKMLLRSGAFSVQQVSDKLCFPNQSFFGKYFKQSVGCSPGRFSRSE